MKKKQILAAFEKLNIDISTWVACGSDHGLRMLENDLFKKTFPNNNYPDQKTICICGHKIKENCYITTPNLDYNNIVIIGNCCYKLFNEKKTMMCILCDEQHSNIKSEKCNKCKAKQASYTRNKRKEIKSESYYLLERYENELDALFKDYCHTILELRPIYKDESKYLRCKEKNRLDQYYKLKMIDITKTLLTQYVSALEWHFNELNDEYKPVFNGFKLLNKFAKVIKPNRKIWFKFCDTYNISCLYENGKHIYTMNLNTIKPTKNSPSQERIL